MFTRNVGFSSPELTNISKAQDDELAKTLQPQIKEMQAQIKFDDETIKQFSFLNQPAQNPIKSDVLDDLATQHEAHPNIFTSLNLDHIVSHTSYDSADPVSILQFQHTIMANLTNNEQLLPYFDQLSKFMTHLNEVIVSNDRQKLIEFANDIAKDVFELKPGQSYVMAGGLEKVQGSDHYEMYYEFQRTENGNFDIYVYNVNPEVDSVQGATVGSKKVKVRPFKYYPNISQENLLFSKDENNIQSAVFEQLLAARICPIWDKSYVPQKIEDTYRIFGSLKSEEERPIPPQRDFEITPPRSKNSTSGCLDALTRGLSHLTHKDGENYYKYVMMMTKLASLMAKFQCYVEYDATNGSSLLDKESAFEYCYQIQQAAKSLCASVSKWHGSIEKNKYIPLEMLQGVLSTAKHIEAEVTKLLVQKREVKGDFVSYESDKASHTNNIRSANAQLDHAIRMQEYRKRVYKDSDRLPANTLPLIKVPEPNQLSDFLNQHIEHLDKFCRRPTWGASLFHVESIIESLPIPGVDEKYWQDVPQDQLLNCMKVLRQLGNIHRDLSACLGKQYYCKTHNNQMALLAIVFELTKRLDVDLLSKYTLDISMYESLPVVDNYYVVTEQRDLEKRRSILKYFKQQGNKPAVFSKASYLLEWGKDTSNYKDLPDVQLYEEIRSQKNIDTPVEELMIDLHLEKVERVQKPIDYDANSITPGSVLLNNGYEHLVLLKHQMLNSMLTMGMGSYYKDNSLFDERLVYDKNAGCSITILNILDSRKGSSSSNIHYGKWFVSKYASSSQDERRVLPLSFEAKSIYDGIYSWIKQKRLGENEHLTRFDSSIISSKLKNIVTPFCEKGLQAQGVVHEISKSVDHLKDKGLRAALMHLFFKTEKDTDNDTEVTPFLLREIETNQQGFFEECRRCILEGLQFFYLNQPKQLRDIRGALFFVRFAHNINKFYFDTHRKPAPTLLPENLDIKTWLEDPELSYEDKAAIHLHMVSSYFGKSVESLSTEDRANIYAHWAAFKSNYPDTYDQQYEDKTHLESIENFILTLESSLREKIKEPNFITQVGNHILKVQGLDEGKNNGKWSIDHPILRYDSEMGFYDIDLRTGAIKNPDGLMKPGNMEERDSEFTSLFDNRKFKAQDFGGTKVFTDSIFKRMRLVKTNSLYNVTGGLQKFIAQEDAPGMVEGWYQYVQKYDASSFSRIIPSWLIDDHTLWTPSPANGQIKIVFIEKKTGKVTAVWNTADVIRMVNGDQVELASLKELAFFEQPQHIKTFCAADGKRTKIEFSRHFDSQGKPLQFVYKDWFWKFTNNPNYVLSTQLPLNGPMGRFKDYICLHNMKDDSYKVLVPYRPFKEMKGLEHELQMQESDMSMSTKEKVYFEYDIKDDQPVCKDTEGKLFMAYITLLSKGYLKALEYLKEVPIGEPISQRSLEILKQILNAGNLAKDYSPDACAVRLHAFDLLKWVRPLESPVIDTSGIANVEETHLTQTYIKYLNSINNVTHELLLNRFQELELLEISIATSYKHVRSNQVEVQQQLKARQQELQGETYKEGVYTAQPSFRHTTEEWKPELDTLFLGFMPRQSNCLIRKEYNSARFLRDYEIMKSGTEDEKRALIFQLKMLPEKKDQWVSMLYCVYKCQNRHALPTLKKIDSQDWYDIGNQNAVSAFIMKLKEEYTTWIKAQNTKGSPVDSRDSWKPDPKSLVERDVKASEPRTKANAKLRNTHLVDTRNLKPDSVVETLKTKYLKKVAEKPVINEAQRPKYDLSINPDKDLSDEERVHFPTIQEETKVYEEELLEGWKKNQIEKQSAFLLPTKQEIVNLNKDLEAAMAASKARTEQLKTFIELRLNQAPDPQSEEYWNDQAQKSGNMKLSPTLIRAFRAITKEPEKGTYNNHQTFHEQRKRVSIEELRKLNPYLTAEECDELRQAIINYLIEETSRQQFKRAHDSVKEMVDKAIDHPEIPIYWERASKALAEKRKYVPADNPQALLFEALRGLRVRKGQGRLIRQITREFFTKSGTDEQFGIVIQLIMGGGKTSVILSQLLEYVSNLDKNALFLCHASQFGSVLGNLKEFQKIGFNKDVIVLEISKEKMDSLEKLQGILKTLKKAKACKNPIIIKTGEFQMPELEFLSRAFDKDHCYAELTALTDILLHFHNECVGVLDEVDLNLSILLGVHFPKSVKRKLARDRLALSKEIFKILAKKDVDKIVGLLTNSQADFNKKNYEPVLLPIIAKQLAKVPSLHLPEEYHAAYERYITGGIKAKTQLDALANNFKLGSDETINGDIKFLKYIHVTLAKDPDQDAQIARAHIILSRQLLKSVLKHTLTKSNNRSYGRLPESDKSDSTNKDAPGLKAVPYSGVGTPSNTEFGYVYEAVFYHNQIALNQNVTENIIKWYAGVLAEIAKKQSVATRGFNNTPHAKKFFEVTNVPLSEIFEAGNLAKATAYVNEHPDSRLEIEEEILDHTLTYNERILSSSPISVADQLFRIIAASGTLNKSTTLPKALQGKDDIIFDKGTEGRIMDTLIERSHNGRTHIHKIENDKVSTLLKNVRDNYTALGKPKDFRRVRAIADAGALFKPYENIEVAKEILNFYEKNDEIQGVLFFYRRFDAEKQKYIESFAILKKNGDGDPKLVFLENTKKDEITKHLPLHQIFTYFDDLRTRGSDIPMDAETITQVTFDPQIQTSTALQALTRPRDLFNGQDDDVVILKDTAPSFINNGDDMEGIFKTCIKNHAIEKSRLTFRFNLEQIQQYLRNASIKAMLASVKKRDFDTMYKQLDALDAFVFTKFVDDPAAQYITLEDEEDPMEVIKLYAKTQLAHFEAQLRKCDSIAIFDGVQKIVQKLVDDLEKTNKEHPTLPTKVMHAKHGVPTETNIEMNKEQSKQQEMQKEMENELLKEMQGEYDRYKYVPSSAPATEKEWQTSPKDKQVFETLIKPQIFGLAEVFKDGYEQQRPYWDTSSKDTNTPYETNYEVCFPAYFQMTENFRYTIKQKLPLFHDMQKNANQILIVNENNQIRTLLLSENEGVFFRKWITENSPENVWLVNPNGSLLESRGKALPDKSNVAFHAKFKEAIWYVNFFNGYIHNLIKDQEVEKYTVERLAEGDENRTKSKLKYLFMKSNKSTTQIELFKTHPVFNPYKKNRRYDSDTVEEERIRQYFFSLQPRRIKVADEEPQQTVQNPSAQPAEIQPEPLLQPNALNSASPPNPVLQQPPQIDFSWKSPIELNSEQQPPKDEWIWKPATQQPPKEDSWKPTTQQPPKEDSWKPATQQPPKEDSWKPVTQTPLKEDYSRKSEESRKPGVTSPTIEPNGIKDLTDQTNQTSDSTGRSNEDKPPQTVLSKNQILKHRIKGVLYTFAMPLFVLVNLIKNTVMIIHRGLAVAFASSPERKQALNKQCRQLIVEPQLYAINPIRIFNPSKYLEHESRLLQKLK